MDRIDEFLIFWYYIMIFTAFVGFAGIVEKVLERFPKAERFIEKLLDIDLSDEDSEDEEEEKKCRSLRR